MKTYYKHDGIQNRNTYLAGLTHLGAVTHIYVSVYWVWFVPIKVWPLFGPKLLSESCGEWERKGVFYTKKNRNDIGNGHLIHRIIC